MANIKRANTSGVTKSGVAIADVPDAPTIGSATAAGASTATVAYTAATTGGTASTFTATSTPGSLTGTGSSPITVGGLTPVTSYTFTVRASNSTGASPFSAASNSITTASAISFDSIQSYGGGGATIDFTSIPSTYKHLQIRFIARGTSSNVQITQGFRINSDTGANYANHRLVSTGGVMYSQNGVSDTQGFIGATEAALGVSNVYSGNVIDILDYSNTNKYKTIRILSGVNDNTNEEFQMRSTVWMNTAAITSVSLFLASGSFTSASSFALYGIKG